ncbi:sulfatase family protein [Planctomicrobium sp. SH668]|uniref:sulfatase family protein n=1 Tax=Planctomicrobium sp. SH668 TaxID=3448126 RepID=UPI003F5CA715
MSQRRSACPSANLTQFAAIVFAISLGFFTVETARAERPNIVYILADDLGTGDVQSFYPKGRIATPHLDALAASGMKFTDAHSGSAVCTPTRYGILTGRYAWRTRLKSGVLYGYSPPLIAADRLTVPSFLSEHGYHTACIGKWHLVLDWAKKDDQKEPKEEGANVDYTQPLQNGPIHRGFHYFYGISASLDMPPYIYLENDRVVAVPTTEKKWLRAGPASEDFEAVDILPKLGKKATQYIAERAEDAKSGNPFFLYLPLTSPHTPIVTTAEWDQKSGLNSYADFVMQTDALVGDVVAALQQHQLSENTLIIFTSDNGCSPAANIKELEELGHRPSAGFRGHKADLYDGGHRVPFIVSWPNHVSPGSTSAQTVCLTDLFATVADIVEGSLPANAAEDSVSMLPAFLRKDTQPLREAIVHHSINGSFSIRQGDWKLLLAPGSGGWSEPRPEKVLPESAPQTQLYDLETDPAEKVNLAEAHPEIVDQLTQLLQRYVDDGRSTPGVPQSNTGKVDIFKGQKREAK